MKRNSSNFDKAAKLICMFDMILAILATIAAIVFVAQLCCMQMQDRTTDEMDPTTTTEPMKDHEKETNNDISELEIISIFSGSNPEEDAMFLQIIGDSKGLPTIQEVDACWKYMHMHFHVPGYVSNDGINQILVDDISNYVTQRLGGDPTKVFTKGKDGNEEIASLSIYIERTLAEEISVKVFNQEVQRLFGNTELPLTYNQKLAIGELIWLGAWHGGLTDTWNKAEKLFPVGSSEFYLYIWDNFWFSLIKDGTETGSAKASDILFKLFAEDELPTTSDSVYSNTQMYYYTASQLSEVGASGLRPGR